jgi:hypothetical protein
MEIFCCSLIKAIFLFLFLYLLAFNIASCNAIFIFVGNLSQKRKSPVNREINVIKVKNTLEQNSGSINQAASSTHKTEASYSSHIKTPCNKFESSISDNSFNENVSFDEAMEWEPIEEEQILCHVST